MNFPNKKRRFTVKSKKTDIMTIEGFITVEAFSENIN